MASVIPLTSPDITAQEIDAVVEVLRSGLLTEGPKLDEFEQACAQVAGRRQAVGVCSGTAAIHCAMLASGIGHQDEVITSPFSYIGTTNALLTMEAKPVFVDVNPKTLNLDPEKVEAAITPHTRAIVSCETFGHPGGIDELEQIAQRHELLFIENASEAFGAKLNGRPIGSFGRASCLSFHATKQITSGEGGMILTDDDRMAFICRSLRNHGRANHMRLEYSRIGFSYRMSEMSAALGLVQVSRIQQLLESRRRAAREYFDRLIDNRYVTLPTLPDDVAMSWYVFGVRLNDLFEPGDRDELIKQMRTEGVECGNMFPPLHLQHHIMEKVGTKRGMFPVCEYIAERTVALPLFSGISTTQIEHVVSALDRAIEKVLMGRCKGRF